MLILNLPNPPERKVTRDYAGGFGVAVRLPRIRRKGSGKPYLNLFMPYLAAVAQEFSCEYKVVDGQVLQLSETRILETVKKLDPDIVFSMISLPSIYEDKKTLGAVKQELPNTLVVACGSVCNAMPQEVLLRSNLDLVSNDSFPYVNSVRQLLVDSKKPYDLRKLPGFSYVKDDEVRSNPSKQQEKEFVDYQPIYDILPLKEYEQVTTSDGKRAVQIPILGSKGCPYPCSYCPYPIGFGKKAIFKKPNSVVDEIEHLNQIGVEYFDFRNQSFTLNRKWAKTICREIINRKLDIRWACEARVDETSREILKEMQSAGCDKIYYGVETGDPTLIRVGKPGAMLQNTISSFKAAREIGVLRHAHVILGLPGENRKTLQESSKFLLKIDPDSITLNFATPYPGTQMHEIAEKNNWIITHEWKYYSSFDVVMTPPTLNAVDLYRAAMQMKNSLLKQERKQIFTHPNKNRFKLVTDNGFQVVMNYIHFINRIRNFRRMIKKHQTDCIDSWITTRSLSCLDR